MGILLFDWMRRRRDRRRFLDREQRKASEEIARSYLSKAAPEIADAILALRRVVAGSSYDAAAAAHDALAAVCEDLVRGLRQDFDRRHTMQAEDVRTLAMRCRDEVERAHAHQKDQADTLRELRDLYAALRELAVQRRSGDWPLKREACFRFIGIVDRIDDRLAALHADPDASEEHVTDLDRFRRETLHALELCGVRQTRHGTSGEPAGRADRLQQNGDSFTANLGQGSRVTRRPGYVFVQDDLTEQLLRPPESGIPAAEAATNLQES